MASPDPELRDGFTLPVWMKSKPAKEFEPFAASPPAQEDIFYIRYPKTDMLFSKKLDQELPKIMTEAKELSSAHYNVKEKDWSKHTKPCQEVLHGISPINTAAGGAVSSKPKSAGVDDGFKGEGAACGSSVLKVAHQMIQTKPRGFTVASPEDDIESEAQSYHRVRRGSRSLPATPGHSPHGSPTSRRKKSGNRYFTSPFEPVEDGSARSWLSMALLGLKKELATSSSTLAEEDAGDSRLHGGSLAQSVESLGPAPRAARAAPSPRPAPPIRPKPTELREMNFWSPTSM